jgi:hypothetical protein
MTIASGAATSSTIQLGEKAWSRTFVEVLGSMSTAASLDLWESLDGVTFFPACERVNTATLQYQPLAVATSVGASTGRAPIALNGPYVQFRASAVVSGGVLLNVTCKD